MRWNEARNHSLDKWREIGEMIGKVGTREFIEEINKACGMCLKAKEERARSGDKGLGTCNYCLGFQQYGGCDDLRVKLSNAAMDGDWTGVREMIDDAVRDLANLRIQDDASSRP